MWGCGRSGKRRRRRRERWVVLPKLKLCGVREENTTRGGERAKEEEAAGKAEKLEQDD